ncbi:MAG TPA: sigma-70 family RNA polymerase sigma factor [Burkholderiales bacterium]|nr:sigma-70 family RNA polymerase sigma factor [Burkholderiales bacterium]
MEDLPIERSGDEAGLARRIAQAERVPDREAEGDLYRRLAPRVRLYGLKHLRDEQAAADLMQQVLLVTIEALRAGKLHQPERIGSFVFGVCRMVVLELRRGGARRERLLEQYAEDVPIADASIAPRLDHERLAKCLDRLSERERTVLLMTFYEEKPAAEVAGLLGLTDGNVRVIRHRGLEHLRDCVTGRKPKP